MRAILFTLSILAAVCFVATGERAASQQAGAPDPNAAKLDEVLNGWEGAMAAMQSRAADCERRTDDKVFATTEVFKGKVRYVKSPGQGQGARASLELFKQTAQGPRQDIFEKFIVTGTFLYEYQPSQKVIRIHNLPPPKQGQVAEDSLLSLVFGIKAVEAKQKWDLTYHPDSLKDQYYHFVMVSPKTALDKADFTQARLALLKTNLLPAQVWFHQPNGNVVTWN